MTQPADSRRQIQDLTAFRLPPGFRGRGGASLQAWQLVQAALFRPSPQGLYGWRRFLLRCFGARIGAGARIRPTARIAFPWKLSIGEHSWVGDFAELYSLGQIDIGAHAVVSQHAYLCAASHDPRARDFAIFAKPIVIGDEAWLAAGVFVHPGVTVGAGAVIGARAVLTRDALPQGVYTGAPAARRGWRLGRDPASISASTAAS